MTGRTVTASEAQNLLSGMGDQAGDARLSIAAPDLARTVVDLANEVERLTRERDEFAETWAADSARFEAERDAANARADAAEAKVRAVEGVIASRMWLGEDGRRDKAALRAALTSPEARS